MMLRSMMMRVGSISSELNPSAKGLVKHFHSADSSKQLNAWYHSSGLVLAALTPIALIVSPYKINMPLDLALGFIFPFHSHVALNYIISDYVPKAARSVARASLLLATLTAAAGILKLNVQGPGLTETLKSLWLKPKK